MHMHASIYAPVPVHVCMHYICMDVCMHECAYTRRSACMYVGFCMCVDIYVCIFALCMCNSRMYAHIHVCIYVHQEACM